MAMPSTNATDAHGLFATYKAIKFLLINTIIGSCVYLIFSAFPKTKHHAFHYTIIVLLLLLRVIYLVYNCFTPRRYTLQVLYYVKREMAKKGVTYEVMEGRIGELEGTQKMCAKDYRNLMGAVDKAVSELDDEERGE
ncbi:uncharacterized protein K460DRAFT_400306 [Cucurbitaria berberidis CBS 394.84]|uniref:Uncharacterized protein n=1 Tax=Cucurbitaria berberidis CBS 394.84 TaxID=1168544 RepID=A0A9P4LDC2_9PLEO|nr:uncharacterized protein K460DRAFT_400306 [Cucurbitaria berberidis CBS 394.84]KAF1850237.1 hypothetical protein K460DRAFT_400306 [Cucurbitaria berberidis CBS 394.84]